MRTRIAGVDDTIGVQIWDDEDREHRVILLRDGTVDIHEQDAFPHDPDERTEEQETIIQRVRWRAKYEAHNQTDVDLIDSNWNPAVLGQGIRAIEDVNDETFKTQFREYYDAIESPPVDVPIDHVKLVVKGLRVEDNALVDTTDVLVHVEQEDTFEWVGNEDDIESNVLLHTPPATMDFPFGDRFREYLVHHLKCQIRDIQIGMGKEPDPEYQRDGYGKPLIR
jgi:hypothetical protein